MIVKHVDVDSYNMHLFHEGSAEKAYELFGAHFVEIDGIRGVRFTTYAPNAKEVRVVGDFNGWSGESYKMWKYTESGIWSIFVSDIGEYVRYKYEIVTHNDEYLLKTDPFGFYAEYRPNTASMTYDLSGYSWNDDEWMMARADKDYRSEPVSVYEVNVSSWRREGDKYYDFSRLVDELVPYVRDLGFTHIELMPVTEHPFDGSWGYQQTGYFAISSRYGTPKDFMYFVDSCHRNGIGVIVDWVPCHYPKDSHGLYMYDGSPVYESNDPKMAYNPQWDTMNFDYSKGEVRSFLRSSAHFLLDMFHVDGLRVDAVAYMLYANMSTGGHEQMLNHDAIEFLKSLNFSVTKHKGVMMIAEESSAFPRVTWETSDDGLGFTFKWNMGWMNDTLEYFELDPIYRKYHHDNITFGMVYAFSESFMMPLSHDEVVHGKGSLINKMPGEYFNKFAQLRQLYTYQYTLPGKKLLFMGAELAQFSEWNEFKELDWSLLGFDSHMGTFRYLMDLNWLYRKEPALYQVEDSWDGFDWLECENRDQSVFIYERMARDGSKMIIAHNFTPLGINGYWIRAEEGNYSVVLNSDDSKYYGRGLGSYGTLEPTNGVLIVDLPPLGSIVIKKEA